jgi:hypothetical protein
MGCLVVIPTGKNYQFSLAVGLRSTARLKCRTPLWYKATNCARIDASSALLLFPAS